MTEPAEPAERRSAPAPLVVGPESAEGSLGDVVDLDDIPVDEAPAAVAVVIARDPGDHFEEALAAIGGQDYPNLSVLVVDANSETPVAERVAGVLPDAFIHRMTGSATFTSAANQALTLVEGAAFLFICHDDVAPDSDCLSVMVAELFRSNAGLVTPKIVKWNDPRRLRALGRGSDRFGVQVDLVEPDEFDQEQYDSVRDVFVAPGGAQLIRADLFGALGGFDTAMSDLSSDLDLSWRAHAAGARVIAVPDARVRHEEIDDHGTIEIQRRDLGRHRLRTLLVTSSKFSLVRVLPLAVLLLLIEALYSLFAGRRRQAASAIGALTWNAGRLGEIRERRRALDAVRTVPDNEIHDRQVGGSARLSNFFRGQFAPSQDRFGSLLGSMKSSFEDEESSSARTGALLAAILGVILLFGSRHLITRGVVPVGQIPDLPSAGAMLGEWFGGWRTAGLGSPGNASSALLIFGLLRVVFFWADGIPQLLLVLGPILVGAVGAWRLVRPLGSPQASGAAAIAYALNPLLVSAIAAGRWDALVIWGMGPLLLGSLLRLQGNAPYGTSSATAGPGVEPRAVPIRLLRFGLAVAFAATFVPAAPIVAVVMAVLVMVASVIVARPAGISRVAMAIPVAVFVPAALHLPWTYDVMRNGSWDWYVGPASPESAFDSLADLLRFAPGSIEPSLLTLGLLAAAGISLAIGTARRFDLAATGWTLAVGAALLGWIVRRDWVPFALPDTETLLVPAAAGLALAVGTSIRAIETDLAADRAPWRRAVVAVGVAGLVVFSLGGLRAALDGQWELPSQGYGAFNSALVSDDTVASRVLWLAAPEVASFDTNQSAGGIHYAVTIDGRSDVRDRWAPGTPMLDAQLGEQLDLAVDGQTVRLGRLLAVYGIDLVVVMEQVAPLPYDGPRFDPTDGDEDVIAVLRAQLDLQRVTGTPSLTVFRNRASIGPTVTAPFVADIGIDPIDRLDVDLTAGTRSGLLPDGAEGWSSATELAGTTVIAVPANGWSAASSDVTVGTSASGFLTLEPAAGAGPVSVSYDTPLIRWLAIVLQIVLVLAAIILAQTRRELAPASLESL